MVDFSGDTSTRAEGSRRILESYYRMANSMHVATWTPSG
jgi:hypothetical protein